MRSGWKFAAASVIGTSHSKSEVGICQDSHACGYFDKHECLVCVVSDGAGSAAFAEIGSSTACQVTFEEVSASTTENLFSVNFAKATVKAVQLRLSQCAAERQCSLRQFACTLLVAIVSKTQATFWQIGDGAICFRVAGESDFHYAFWPAKGEYANMTSFLTDPNGVDQMEFDQGVFSIIELAVFSDGLERLALDFKLQEAHTPFLSPLFPVLHRAAPGHVVSLEAEIVRFLSSDAVNSRTDDDKTLALATFADYDE